MVKSDFLAFKTVDPTLKNSLGDKAKLDNFNGGNIPFASAQNQEPIVK
jgi:hypothetical protein